MEINWLTPEEVGAQWGIKVRRVQALCSSGRVPNVIKKGRMWLIPRDAPKPVDGRTKEAREHNSQSNRMSTEKYKHKLSSRR